MAALQGTILASKIVPTDSLDTYATHDDKYGRGGHRSVNTLEERDNITTPRRKEGMTVYVKENKTKYILENGIENANWKVDSSGDSSPSTLTVDSLKAILKGLQDGTISSKEYIVLVNREDDKVSVLSLNTLLDTLISSVGPSGGGGSSFTIEDKTKLDGIEAEATKNKTDGFLLSRSNHTGTIPMSVVENLEQVLANISLGGMTSAELLRIEDIESDITKKADLDSSGKIPASQLPDIASGRKIKVNSEADRLTVSIYPDLTIAYQMDDGSSWVINANDDPSNIANWTKLGSALISQVSSFNGRTGNVSPETGDYTSDMIAETDGKQFVSKSEKISWNNRLTDADKNGKLYGRKNGEWIEIVSSGSNLGGAINADEKEFMLSRSNHTGLQSMNTISGLAESLLGKADINTVYAEPMSTNYTTRNKTLEASKTIKYPLNGINNNYALHAFALKELPVVPEVFLLNTALMDSGYYGVKIPRINNIQLSLPSTNPEPLKRMTTHNQHGQTVSATTEHNADYVAWKIFAAGDAPTATDDCWASSRVPTPSDPQIITFTSPNVFSMSKYKIRSRDVAVASIKTWKIEGRVGNSGNWELIHEVVNDTRNGPLLDRVFDIPKENRKACDQHRLVIFDRNGTEPYTVLSRLIIYQEPSKFMIEDGVNKYRSTSTGFSLSYTPMTKHSEHNQVVSATSEYDATYVVWKTLLSGDSTSNIDCWASIAAPTALAPQIINIDLGQPKKIYSYSIVNRFDSGNNTSNISSPSSWSIEVRNNLLDDWITIDNIQGDKDSNSVSVRKFSIAEEKRGEWRYFRIVIKDRNSTAPYTCISRLRIYGDLIGEELELVPNVITKNDITVNGTSDSVIITKQKLSTLSNPYIITNEPSAIKLTMDSEREYEYSNNVKIALANTYIKFTATESGNYKFCYQEPAPVIP